MEIAKHQAALQNPDTFKTPQEVGFDYEAYYSYGSEMNTASANYRPGNTNTKLRRGKKDSAKGMTRSSRRKPQNQESSAK